MTRSHPVFSTASPMPHMYICVYMYISRRLNFTIPGTLMALPVLYNVIHDTPQPPEHVTSHLTVRPATLKDHRRRFVRHSDYPGITAHKGSEVAGSLVTGLTKRNLRDLHRFEGSEYAVASIKVKVLAERTAGPPGPSGEPTYKNEVWREVDAITYMYIAGEYRLENREWSFNKYMELHMANWSGLNRSQAQNQLCKFYRIKIEKEKKKKTKCVGKYNVADRSREDDALGYWKGATTTTSILPN